jgi:hypothetical protein
MCVAHQQLTGIVANALALAATTGFGECNAQRIVAGV